jgi:hypothetical protein
MIATIETVVLEATVAANARAREMVVTGCCGARYYREIAPEICLLCGTPITGAVRAPERDLTKAVRQATGTRYWS